MSRKLVQAVVKFIEACYSRSWVSSKGNSNIAGPYRNQGWDCSQIPYWTDRSETLGTNSFKEHMTENWLPTKTGRAFFCVHSGLLAHSSTHTSMYSHRKHRDPFTDCKSQNTFSLDLCGENKLGLLMTDYGLPCPLSYWACCPVGQQRLAKPFQVDCYSSIISLNPHRPLLLCLPFYGCNTVAQR